MHKEKVLQFFKDIQFTEEGHKYEVETSRGKEPLKFSVSNVVGKFKNPFDKDNISRAIAIRDGKTQEEVLSSWKSVADTACDLGTKVHKFGELYPYDRRLTPSDKQEEAIAKFWDTMPKHLQLVFCELVMYHKKHFYGGTADIILWDEKRQGYIVADYKTNKDLFKNHKGQTLKGLFNDMLQTPFNGYQIQLSLYQILLEQAGVKVVDRVLVWLRRDGDYEMYKTVDLTDKLKDYA